MDIQLRLRYSVTETLRIAKAGSKSSVFILLDLSAAFDTVNHQTSMEGLSRWPVVGRYPEHINWSLGFLRDQFLDPSSSPHTLHH